MGGISQLSEPTKLVADSASYAVALGVFAKVLPSMAALLTVIWLLIRIWESDTVRGFTGRALTGKRDEE